MSREEIVALIAAAAVAELDWHWDAKPPYVLSPEDVFRHAAEAIYEAVFPQVTTAEEAEALPEGAKAIGRGGSAWEHTPFDSDGYSWWGTDGDSWTTPDLLANFGPLTIVWRPS